jgi:hypothetical protein
VATPAFSILFIRFAPFCLGGRLLAAKQGPNLDLAQQMPPGDCVSGLLRNWRDEGLAAGAQAGEAAGKIKGEDTS